MSNVQIRIDEEEKQKAQRILENMGLTLSGAVKLFLRKVIQEKKIPFEISGTPIPQSRDITPQSPFSKRNIG